MCFQNGGGKLMKRRMFVHVGVFWCWGLMKPFARGLCLRRMESSGGVEFFWHWKCQRIRKSSCTQFMSGTVDDWNPAWKPVEVGSLSWNPTIIRRVLAPSKAGVVGLGFHQQLDQPSKVTIINSPYGSTFQKLGLLRLINGGPIRHISKLNSWFPKDHWTLQWKGERTCFSQGCFFGPQNDATFEWKSDS